MSDPILTRRARSFGAAADAYERARPGYPSPAVRWVLDAATAPVRRVLDLGAGTGKLTRALLQLEVEVIAVDPDAGMLGALATALPGVQHRQGSAEALPLRDGEVDAVVCGQAWHWVDPVRAVPEIARVLRPGGVLGLLWNLRDESVDWVRELGNRMGAHEDAVGNTPGEQDTPQLGPPFVTAELRVMDHRQSIRASELRDLAASRSTVLTLDPGERERVLGGIDELARTHPDLAGRDVVEIPYRTMTWRARRDG